MTVTATILLAISSYCAAKTLFDLGAAYEAGKEKRKINNEIKEARKRAILRKKRGLA